MILIVYALASQKTQQKIHLVYWNASKHDITLSSKI